MADGGGGEGGGGNGGSDGSSPTMRAVLVFDLARTCDARESNTRSR